MVSQNGGRGLERSKMEWAHTTPTHTNTTRKKIPQEFRKGNPHKHGHTHKNSETVHDRPTQTAKLRKKITRWSANKRKPAAAAGPKQQSTTTRGCKQKNEIDALAGLRIQWPEGGAIGQPRPKTPTTPSTNSDAPPQGMNQQDHGTPYHHKMATR